MEAVKGLTQDPVSWHRYSQTSTAPFEVTEVVANLIRRGSRILDIGCGSGALTDVLRRKVSADIVGIEPNAERAQAARALGLNVVIGMYGPHIPTQLGRFDTIVLADVLEHLEDPGSFLEDLHEALADGGQIVASVPNVAHWTVRLALLGGRFDYQPTGIMDATHLRWFTRNSLAALFVAAGYDIDVMTHTAGAWMPQYNRWPFSAFEEHKKAIVINKLAGLAHGLFACQHIVSARLRSG